MKIQILGAGCSKCSRTAQIMKETAVTLGLVDGRDFELEKVTDIKKIMKYKIMLTPGIIVNGKVVSTGKVPSTQEAQQLINKGLAEDMQ